MLGFSSLFRLAWSPSSKSRVEVLRLSYLIGLGLDDTALRLPICNVERIYSVNLCSQIVHERLLLLVMPLS